jgi:hypothetical protein
MATLKTKRIVMPVAALVGSRFYEAGEEADVPVDKIPRLMKAAALQEEGAPAAPPAKAPTEDTPARADEVVTADEEVSDEEVVDASAGDKVAGDDSADDVAGDKTPLADLFDGKTLALLSEAGLKTVGDVEACEDLTTIKGIGEATAATIQAAVEQFRE